MKASEIILRRMKEDGITYRELAAKMGNTTCQNIWVILNGKRGNNVANRRGSKESYYDTVLDMCHALHMTVEIRGRDGGRLELGAEGLEDVPFRGVCRVLEAAGYRVYIDGEKVS